ncbi:MAG: lipid A deacylase LpxR family protein [Gammaproteobacteria bacterium]|nr:lipid A deacylase LpxR family protein [Gammaproteobacteria bacterium]MCW8910606.1 lipid A deacylase LpxR family protein [Gammaproteobacteria bacterium]MCW9003850.1 lipid A deacylase LpxR family protein [Gammaproteobacteria bacterium]MCW9056776.1 lipid A deacylase LpxR family protein [Gammaproteobacteria bacterium]
MPELNQHEYWSIQLENDVLAKSGDHYYTHGTQVSRTVAGDAPQWLQDLAVLFPVFESDGLVNGVNYTVGQKIFTADNTQATQPLINDRPYAGYLYFSASLLSSVSRKNNMDSGNVLEFTTGLVGPSALAEEVQSVIHDLFNSDRVNGWGNQLSDELALGVSYARFWQKIRPLSGSLKYSLAPHVNVTLGNVYTYAASGFMLRVGRQLENDFAPPNIRPGFPGLSLFRPSKQYNWYIFAGMEGRWVVRNIFLDGNTFRDSYSVDKKSLVGDFQFGFVFQTGNVRYSLSNVLRTKEFDQQNGNMSFGAINISFLYK